MGPIKIILIVAECNVNFAFAGMHKIQSYILIVAECNVNFLISYYLLIFPNILIVAECNVNSYFKRGIRRKE